MRNLSTLLKMTILIQSVLPVKQPLTLTLIDATAAILNSEKEYPKMALKEKSCP